MNPVRISTISRVVWMEMIRKRDVYVFLILLAVLLVAIASVDVFNLGGVTHYAKDMGLLLAWLFSWILAVVTSARELPEEERQGTIFSLLAKPVTRGELLAGKWIGAWTVASLATICFYGLLAAAVAAKGGSFEWVTVVQGLALHCCALSIICAFGVMFSTRMSFDAAVTGTFLATGVSFALVPRIPRLVLLLGRDSIVSENGLLAAYYLLPHLELFDLRRKIIQDELPVGFSTIGQAVLYAALVTVAVLLLAWALYCRKAISRGEQT